MEPDDVHGLLQSAGDLPYTYLGSRESQLGTEQNVTLADENRFMHVLTVGPTGYGKTQLMVHSALQDAYKGHGFCMVNPKGDAIDELLAKLPEARHDDIVYINPGRDHLTPINVLEPHITEDMTPAQQENQKEIIVADLIALFRRYSENWGDRFGRVLETLLRAHLDLNMRQPDDQYTLLDVFQCVISDEQLTELIDQTSDQVTREQLVRVKEDMGTYEMEPLQRRLNDFVMNQTVRRVITASESGVDFRDAINNNRIILVDVQKGDVGEMVAQLVGSIVITKIWAAAQSRITIPEAERNPFFLYTDELQNFSGEGSNFTKILSEGREYRLGCWLASQYLRQLAPEMRQAVATNCRTKIVFNPAGSDDVTKLAHMLNGIEKSTLKALGRYRAAIQQPAETQHRNAILFDTYPPWTADRDGIDQLKREATFDTTGTGRQGQLSPTTGRGANAGGEAHDELLQAAHDHFTDAGFQVNLLYQDAGDEKPDGHVILGDQIAHLEAESATLTKPAKVLRNLRRAAEQDRECLFIVQQGDAPKLMNILEDPVNRRGNDHEDVDGSFSYYTGEDGEPMDDLATLQAADYRIFSVRDGTLVEYETDEEPECPELDHSDRNELEAFCLFRQDDGFCDALGQQCVLPD